MNAPNRPKVEAILPLTFMQNALLFHSLSSSDDQGFIHVKLDLIGNLDAKKLRHSWNYLVNRHDAFRSSLHWEKIKSPVQVVHKEADHTWSYEDLRTKDEEARNKIIAQFVNEDKSKGFDFNKASVSRVKVYRLEEDHHLLIWSCHHLLWDGWSSSNLIKELSEVYNSDENLQPLALPPVPSTKEYRRDVKNNDSKAASAFWKTYLNDFDSPSLVNNYKSPSTQASTSEGFKTMSFSLDQNTFEKLETYVRSKNLTMTSALQMAWSIVLNGIEKSGDVAFGNIVSVRSPRLKNAEMMCGLFTNMLPVRVQMKDSESPSSLASRIQSGQGDSKDYSFVSMDELQKWMDWPGYLPMFDHIFVVENFPWQDIQLDALKFSNFRSGITSSFPLTIVAKVNQELKLDFIFETPKLSEGLISALGKNMLTVLQAISEGEEQSINHIMEKLVPIEIKKEKDQSDQEILDRAQNHQIDQPSNPMELTLTRMWEDLFMRDGIGIHDNFFEIGGKSLLAVRLFQTIQKELDLNAPPIMILKYPTISQLASYLGGDQEEVEWKSLVPLRVKGNRNPLFCLHAKGGHVFFYNKFASYLDNNVPIYALQPRGLNGEDSMYSSIEEMAGDYIREIKTIQSEGPYNILATCFSNAVGLEMAQQLKASGEEIENLFMVDAAPGKSLEAILDDRGVLAKVNYKLKNTALYNTGKSIYKNLRGGGTVKEEVDFATKHEKHLEKIFSDYKRKRYDDKIILIRSTEFEKMKVKDFHVEDWLKIVSEENLVKMTVVGHHQTLFLEPEVQDLARAFNQHFAQ